MGTAFKLSAVAMLAVFASRADQVTLKNGDRVTGAIVKKDAKSLTVKSDLMGVVTIAWEKVETVQSDAPLNVVLPDRTVKATLGAVPGMVELKEEKQTIAPSSVVAIRDSDEQKAYERLVHPGWMDLWAGGATAVGSAKTSGNARTRTFTTAATAARLTNSDKTNVYFNAIKASALIEDNNAATAEALRGGWSYSHSISPRLFLSTFNDYEYDRFQNLDLRFVLGGGLGYIAWKGERDRFDLLGGAAYNREKFAALAPGAGFTRNSAEAYWGDDYNLKLNSAISLVQSFRMFNNLSNTGEYRMNFDLGANTRIAKWLTWNFGISDRYLSNPVPGRKSNDFLYTTGLGVTFAR